LLDFLAFFLTFFFLTAFFAFGQPVAAIGVDSWISAPFWATIDVGIVRLDVQRFPIAVSAE
jgi:hypothetical protein